MTLFSKNRPVNIRKLLVTWQASVLAGILLVFSIGLYAGLNYHLNAEVDDSLSAWTDYAIRTLEADSGREKSRIVYASADHGKTSGYLETFALVFDRAGNPLAYTDILTGMGLGVIKALIETRAPLSPESFATADLDSTRYRIYIAGIHGINWGTGYTIVAGRSLMHVSKTLSELAVTIAVVWLGVVLACIAISWIFVGRTLHPVKMMTSDALRIAVSGQLDKRIVEFGRSDEFGALSSALNSMLGTLANANQTLGKFLADASHELRTPLTSIKSNLDFLRRAAFAPEDERVSALSDSIAETERMTALVNNMLLLARAQSQVAFAFSSVELARLVRDAISSFKARAREQKKRIRAGHMPGIHVHADPEKLRQAIVILLDNAIKFSPGGGAVSVAIKPGDGTVSLVISDSGPGIPDAEMDLVFGRFYRATNVRSRFPGSGLGLAIVKSILDSHNADIRLRNLKPNGLEARISIPLVGSKRAWK